jgi:TldD protein
MLALADYAIKFAKELGADYAEARVENTAGNSFLFKNGVLEGSEFGEGTGLGVRLLINNTIGFATTNILTEESVKSAVKKALELAKSAKRTKILKFAEAEVSQQHYVVKQKKSVVDVSPEAKLEFLKLLDSSLLGTKLEIPTRYFSLSDELVKKIYLNSEGTKITSEIPRVNLFYFFTIKHNAELMQRMWQAAAAAGWEVVDKWKMPEILAEEANALWEVAKSTAKVPSKPIDVVVGPQVSGIIAHESCGHPFEADRIFGREAAQAGESWITPAMIGKKLASPVVNLVDFPDIENAYGFYKYDDEGVKARKRYLIKKGIINEFLHNRESAAAASIKSNGSARASDFAKEPLVRMSNTYFEPGEQSEEELIEGIRQGVYFKSFTEWNIDDMRYNNRYVSAEAYLIENGKLTTPVKNAVFEITTPALYAAIDAVGKNLEFHPASCGKGEPMQGIPVTHGGGSLRLRKIMLR